MIHRTLLDRIERIHVSPRAQQRLGLISTALRLRRVWPRSQNHLLLEFSAGGGNVVAGQWIADTEQLEYAARKTRLNSRRKNARVIIQPSLGIILQADGADRRMPALAELAARPGARLLVHRPEQRAVVRLELPQERRYAKVVPPERALPFMANARALEKIAGRTFSVPELLAADLETGILSYSALPGRSLYDLLGTEHLISAARAAGETLLALHSVSDFPHVSCHGAAEEIAMLRLWLDHVETFLPRLYSRLNDAAPPVFKKLAAAQSEWVVLHRDLYDKQTFFCRNQPVGLLDFDTLARGEPALDIANALVHFELRTLQRRLTAEKAAAASTAFLEGYQPKPCVGARLNSYVDAARLRLACVYAFRPPHKDLVVPLLSRIGQSIENDWDRTKSRKFKEEFCRAWGD